MTTTNDTASRFEDIEHLADLAEQMTCRVVDAGHLETEADLVAIKLFLARIKEIATNASAS
ncbi:MAG: hypothetical protein KDG55_08730 [Rhodocyclaceae bacterium]|nr:hypothetical protein [Rhodocyclaceae bacterium]